MAEPVTGFLNKQFLPNAPKELRDISTRVALDNPHAAKKTMYGLKHQQKITPYQFGKILDNFPMTIVTNPDDKVVSEAISLNAIGQAVKAGGGAIFPVCVTEKEATVPGGHYVLGMGNRMVEFSYTRGAEQVRPPLQVLPAIYDKILQRNLIIFSQWLRNELLEIQGQKQDERDKNLVNRLARMFSFVGIEIDVSDFENISDFRKHFEGQETENIINETEKGERMKLLSAFQETLRYYKLLWPQ